jgi:hypothetical protein
VEIGKANAERNYLAYLILVKTKIVAVKVCPKMPPAVLEQAIDLYGRDTVSVKLFVDELEIGIEHGRAGVSVPKL